MQEGKYFFNNVKYDYDKERLWNKNSKAKWILLSPAVYYNISKKMRTVYIKEAILRMLKSWSALLCQLNQSRYVACMVHKWCEHVLMKKNVLRKKETWFFCRSYQTIYFHEKINISSSPFWGPVYNTVVYSIENGQGILQYL